MKRAFSERPPRPRIGNGSLKLVSYPECGRRNDEYERGAVRREKKGGIGHTGGKKDHI